MPLLQAADEKQPGGAEASQGRLLVVLLVDDDITTLHMLSGMLRQEGIATLNAATVQEARALIAGEPFDLAVLDVNLPDGNGLDLCRWVRRQSHCAGIPVLMLSAEQDVRTKVAGFDAGAVDYITKPFHRAEVMARVRTQLQLHAAHRAVIELQALKLAQLASAQQAMIPQPERMPEAKFHLYYKPLQEAGGDFCYVSTVGRCLHDYIVGDVCGHHVGTAMTTAALQALLRQNCSALYSPLEILNTVNRVARSMFADGQYATAVYARVNRQTRRLSLASAGHPPAVLQKSDGAITALWQEGDVVGAFDSPEFGCLETAVSPGDRVFLLSDAMIEGLDPASGGTDRQKGVERLMDECRRCASMEPGAALAGLVEYFLKSGAPSDDITLMAIEI
jgi:sigma-B regulation protein RsbU (phosphoserine phosphatase)